MFKNLFYILFLSISALPVLAQNTGTISGTVIDARTKEPLIGANVIIVDTQRGASTNLEGEYTITNVPIGTYRLRFDYIGYTSVFETDVVVIAARPVFRNVEMESGFIEGEEVTVTAGYFFDEEKTQPSTIGLSRADLGHNMAIKCLPYCP